MHIQSLSDQRSSAASMNAASCTARQARAHHRFDLRALTYVGLDTANGGIVRNLSHTGIAAQAVSALRAGDVIRVRFELRRPRLRVEVQGEVMWATVSGQCGIRFLDLPPRMARQINEWIFGNLLESIPQHWTLPGSMFHRAGPTSESAGEDDGLVISAAPRKVIQIPPRISAVDEDELPDESTLAVFSADELRERDWLSQPLSGRTLAWTIDSLAIVAGLLLVSLVFLSVVHELPKWPLNVEAGLGAVVFVSVFYWGFFQLFGGSSLGARLAQLTEAEEEDESARADRFR